MKRLLIIVLVLVVLITLILLRFSDKPSELTALETGSGKTLEEKSQPKPANPPKVSAAAAYSSLPKVPMKAIQYEIDYATWSRELSNPPFEFRGSGTSGRVINSQGKTLIESSEEIRIFGIALSPDKKKILVKGGDGKNLILEPLTNQRIILPFTPPGSNLFPFSWHWIGPNLLFGISGVEKVFHEGPHENCCNDNNVAQTKFYTFDLLTEQLSDVVMPSSVTQTVVNVLEVMSDGHIHLQHEAPPEGVEPDLGWFKIDTEK